MSSNEGRCVSCGFLGKQDRRRDTAARCPGTFEVEWLERVEPAKARFGVNPWAQATIPTELICYRGAAFLPTEIGDTDSNDVAKAALWRDRKCDVWIKYMPGHNPPEHLMERRMQEMENDRRQFQIAIGKHGRWIALAALLLTAAQLLTMTPDSLLYKWVASVYHRLAGPQQ